MKSRKTVFNITIAGLFTAMITVLTAYIAHIPFGGSGGYIHFGDSFIYLAACLLPTPYAIIASALGASLADLLTAPLWIIPTIVIKALISIPFTSKSKKIINKKKRYFNIFCRCCYNYWLLPCRGCDCKFQLGGTFSFNPWEYHSSYRERTNLCCNRFFT